MFTKGGVIQNNNCAIAWQMPWAIVHLKQSINFDQKCKWYFKFENETEWIEIGVMWCKTYSYLLENSTNW